MGMAPNVGSSGPTYRGLTQRPTAVRCAGNARWCRCRVHYGLRTLEGQRVRIAASLAAGVDSGPSDEDFAWAAGLFTGEGWCGVIRRGAYVRVQLAVSMLD